MIGALAVGLALGLVASLLHKRLAPRFGERRTPHAVVILTTMAVSFAFFLRFGFGAHFSALSLIGALTVAASCVDLDTLVLPDVLTFPLMLATPVASITLLGMSPTASIGGGVLCAATLTAAGYAGRLIGKKNALGLGDVKLGFALGALTGPAGLPMLLMTASVAALAALPLLRRREAGLLSGALPFGPFLCFGAFLTLFSAQLSR